MVSYRNSEKHTIEDDISDDTLTVQLTTTTTTTTSDTIIQNKNSNNDDNNNHHHHQDDATTTVSTTSHHQQQQQPQHHNNNNNNCDATTTTTTTTTNNNNMMTTIALCVSMLTHSYLLISVFPYSGFLVLHLLQQRIDKEDDAAKYAGLMASSFMIGRACTSVLWGMIVDRYGRRLSLYMSLLLSAFFSILFGFTKHFISAMIMRFLLGCSNGIVATIKTMVSDMHSNNVKIESRIMNIVMGMWGWGFLISPVISGYLAEPIKQYNNHTIDWIAEGTFFGTLLRTYPFLLPNLVGAVLCMTATILALFFVHETLPVYRQHSIVQDIRSFFLIGICSHYLPFVLTTTAVVPSHQYEMVPTNNSIKAATHSLDLDEENGDDDNNKNNIDLSTNSKEGEKRTTTTFWKILAQRDLRDCIVLLWGYSFVGLAIDEAFPLFCLSHIAGFGVLERDIGTIMSWTGLIFAIAQYFVAHYSYKYCGGLTGSTKVGAALSAPTMFLIPISLLINHHSQSLTIPTYIFLAITLSIHRCFSMVFFSNIAVIMNRSVTTANRGAMNGIAGLGASFAKAFGPTFAGVLITCSVSWFHEYASLLIFGTLGLFGMVIAWGTIMYLPDNSTSNVVHSNNTVGAATTVVDDDNDDTTKRNNEKEPLIEDDLKI